MSHDCNQTSPPTHELDTNPPKRQRLDSTVAPDQHVHPNLAAYPPKSHVDPVGGHAVRTNTTQSFTDTQQLEIYYAWHRKYICNPELLPVRSPSNITFTEAGSPHNYVCYECRKPYDLICCKTCCRAYHINCLSSKPAENALQNAALDHEWHCDACKQRQWDTKPPLSHELPSHSGFHPSQSIRSHSWAATSNRFEAPSRKLQSFSEGHYPRRSSKLRYISDTSIEDTARFLTGFPHSHPFEGRPREPSRISEGEEPMADEVHSNEQQTTLALHERPANNIHTPPQSEGEVIAQMRVELETLREELGRKDREARELEELRKENALLKAKIESLEAASVNVEEPTTGSSL
jgi:hypothetical protein